jgi:hypothetical protein
VDQGKELVHGGLKTGHGNGLARVAPFDCSGRWELTAMEEKGRGEPWDSHHELHGAAHGLSWLDGDE